MQCIITSLHTHSSPGGFSTFTAYNIIQENQKMTAFRKSSFGC